MNKVVPKSDVLKTAVEWAQEIVGNSPDSIQSTKRALMLSNQLGNVEDVVVAHTRSKEMLRAYASENLKVRSVAICVPFWPLIRMTGRTQGFLRGKIVLPLPRQVQCLNSPQKKRPVWKNPAKL